MGPHCLRTLYELNAFLRLYNLLDFITLFRYSLDSSNFANGSRFQLRPNPGLSCFAIDERDIAISQLPPLFYIAFQGAHLHKSSHQKLKPFFDSLLFHCRKRAPSRFGLRLVCNIQE